MLSYLDCIIFPDRCEVIELVPAQRYVYPIFKNGRSSFQAHADENKCRILINNQIKKLNLIDVFLRDPQERIESGINTFIQMTKRDHPNLDADTISWFAQNYLFLNRHYAPQFLWLVNLARYLSADAELNFLPMEQIKYATEQHEKPGGISPIADNLAGQLKNIPNIEMYQRIDQLLMTLVGKQLTFDQLIKYVKDQDPTAYDLVIGRSQRILEPMYVLSKT